MLQETVLIFFFKSFYEWLRSCWKPFHFLRISLQIHTCPQQQTRYFTCFLTDSFKFDLGLSRKNAEVIDEHPLSILDEEKDAA